MGIDKAKMKTIEKLKDAGFDTANKIRNLDMEDVCEHGLESEIKNIIDLKKAIKANHNEMAWLLDGTDPEPSRKESRKNAGHEADTAGAASY